MYKRFEATRISGMQDHSVRSVTLDEDELTIELFKGRKFKANYYTITGEWTKSHEKKYAFTLKSEWDSICLFDSDFVGFELEQKHSLIEFLIAIPNISRPLEDVKIEKEDEFLSTPIGKIFSGIAGMGSCLLEIIVAIVLLYVFFVL